MRYFTGFLIILCSVIFWMLPVSDAVYAFKTEPRTDQFYLVTPAGITSNASVLHKFIFDDDTATLSLTSDLPTDLPVFVSYNTTTRLVNYAGLTSNATRQLYITYDVTAFNESGPWDAIINAAVWLLFIFFVVFPIGGLWIAFKPDLERIF